MQHTTALNKTQMSVLRLVLTGYVSCCTTCSRKSLHEGGFELVGEGAGTGC